MIDSVVPRVMHAGTRFWRRRLLEESSAPVVKRYRLQFRAPYLVAILVASCVLPILLSSFASPAAGFGNWVGLYLFLLSLVVLLPLAFKANTESGDLPFPGAPFVGLNFLYFVTGTVALLAYPAGPIPNVSLPTVPLAILLLAVGFALYAAGVAFSGRSVRRWLPESIKTVTVQGMGAVAVVVAGVVLALRIYFAARGIGITHAGSAAYLALPRETMALVTGLGQLQYVPICLCVARLCNRSLPRREVHAWQTGLAIVLASDVYYFVWSGARLQLLMEFLVLLWAMWLRLLPMFSRRWYVYTGLVLVLAIPVVYAQRAALKHVSPHMGEDQLAFTRDYLFREQVRLLQRSPGQIVWSGYRGEAGRFAAISAVSAVVDKILNKGYPLMWGETLKEGLPFLVPQVLWPSKPVQVVGKNIIQRHFGLRVGDEVNTVEEEALANFGIAGFCLWMFLLGVVTNKFFGFLIKMAPAHEPITFCLLYALPVVSTVETDITGILGGLRFLPVWFILLMLMSVRHNPLP